METAKVVIKPQNVAKLVDKHELQELKAQFDTIKGATFVYIENYTNKHGEVSNQLLCVKGIPYTTVLKKDIKNLPKIKGVVFADLAAKFGADVVDKGFEEKAESFRKSVAGGDELTKGMIGQREAYFPVTSGIKVCLVTGNVHIYGYVVSKKVLVKGVYPVVKSRPLTLVKKEIDKKTKSGHYRNFIVPFCNVVKSGGRSFKLTLEG